MIPTHLIILLRRTLIHFSLSSQQWPTKIDSLSRPMKRKINFNHVFIVGRRESQEIIKNTLSQKKYLKLLHFWKNRMSGYIMKDKTLTEVRITNESTQLKPR